MKNKVIVTGSSGLIGTAFCERLREKKIQFLGVDKVKNRWNSYIDAVTMLKDLTKGLQNFRTNFDMTVHFAANARVFDLVKDPDLARDNILMTYNMLEFARKNGIKKFIFASSREVYGNEGGHLIYNEDDVNLDFCESPYTASKMAGEALVHAYCRCYGIDYVIIRFSNVYGRYDYNDRVIPLFIAKALKNQPLTVFGENKVLDFTYIDDAINGVYEIMRQFKQVKNRTYNLATGEGYSLTDIAKKIRIKTHSTSIIAHKKSRTGEVEQFVADIGRAESMFGYAPKHGIDQGLAKTIEWYKPRLEEYIECLRGEL